MPLRRCSGASAWPWLMPMAPGWPSRSSPPRCRIATRLRLLIQARRRGPACGRRSWTGPSRLHPVTRGRTGTACAIVGSNVTQLRKALSCSRAAGSWNAASAGLCIGVDCCGIELVVWTSPRHASRSPPSCPASRPYSTRCQSKTPQVKPTQTGLGLAHGKFYLFSCVSAGLAQRWARHMCSRKQRRFGKTQMANPQLNTQARDQAKRDEQDHKAAEAARSARTVTDEAARVGEQTARAGADVFRRGTEAARDSLQAGLNTATLSFQMG